MQIDTIKYNIMDALEQLGLFGMALNFKPKYASSMIIYGLDCRGVISLTFQNVVGIVMVKAYC